MPASGTVAQEDSELVVDEAVLVVFKVVVAETELGDATEEVEVVELVDSEDVVAELEVVEVEVFELVVLVDVVVELDDDLPLLPKQSPKMQKFRSSRERRATAAMASACEIPVAAAVPSEETEALL